MTSLPSWIASDDHERSSTAGRVAFHPAAWDHPAVAKPAIDLARMSRSEQLELLDELWGLLGRDPDAFPLTAEQTAELDRRIDEMDAGKTPSLTWDEVVAKARSGK
jgi:putative addiction module component (TIGR02574 family)